MGVKSVDVVAETKSILSQASTLICEVGGQCAVGGGRDCGLSRNQLAQKACFRGLGQVLVMMRIDRGESIALDSGDG